MVAAVEVLALGAAVAVLVVGLAKVAIGFRSSARIGAMQRAARAAGLRCHDNDPFDTLPHTPLTLLQRGDERRVQHVVWDPADREGPRAFDFVWTDVTRDHEGNEHRTHQQQICALARFPLSGTPPLMVVPESPATRLATAMGAVDIELESIAVNRGYAVRCPDARFALAFCDSRVQDLLDQADGDLWLEVRGGWLLLATDHLAGESMPAFRRLAADLARPAAAVTELYGPGGGAW